MNALNSIGGPWMIPIIIGSMISVTLIIERTIVLFFRYSLNTDEFVGRIIGYLEEKNFSKAIEQCNVEGTHPLSSVLKSGLMKANESDKDIQRAMEAATMNVVPRVTKRTNYLSMLANVSTLMGLLGTIMGLIDCFEAVKNADAAAKQEALSAGISVAMFTTAGGLIAAIPSIIAFAVLQNRQNEIVGTLEAKATDLFNYLSARNRRLKRRAG